MDVSSEISIPSNDSDGGDSEGDDMSSRADGDSAGEDVSSDTGWSDHSSGGSDGGYYCGNDDGY